MTHSPVLDLINAWKQAKAEKEPGARYCTLASLDEEGMPRLRTVVVRDVQPEYIDAYVNASAGKRLFGADAQRTEILMLWPDAMRQFRLRGIMQEIPADELAKHWAHKPYGAKLLDHLYHDYLPQGATVSSREYLEQALAQLRARFPDEQAVPFIRNATGARLTINYLEVWEADPEQSLHYRTLHTRQEKGWQTETLVP